MTNNKDEKRQTFLYKWKTYKFRIQADTLRKMERETGKRADEIALGTTEGKYTILYYCTCWKEDSVSLEQFLRDCRIGLVMFRPGAHEYSSVGLYRLFLSKIREFKKRGEL